MGANKMKSLIIPGANLKAQVKTMGAQEEPSKKKEFQKRTEDDIDSFLSRKEFSKTSTAQTSAKPAQEAPVSEPPPPPPPEAEDRRPLTEEEQESQIKAARASRAESEAYQDVAVLRKKAHAFGHKAAKLYHKYKANEAKAQKCSQRAVAYREKAEERTAKAKGLEEKGKGFEGELAGAASGQTEMSPEALRTKIAQFERKVAKQNELVRRNESKAATQTAKAAKFRTKAAKFLEQNKLFESEAKRYSKRADNLERAGI